jgi:pSer/pThr/pTyr-binding forkhead associated (FHA) protein
LLDNSFVSRHHCALLMDDYTLRIRDLGSKNGTFVNSVLAPIGARILAHGDTIRVADLFFRVEVIPSQVAMDGTDGINLDPTQFDGRPPADCTSDPPSTAEVWAPEAG